MGESANHRRWIDGTSCLLALLIVGAATVVSAQSQTPQPQVPQPQTPTSSTAELLNAAAASEWREISPENTLYMELPGGRVIIELNAAYAPVNAAAVRALVREGYFDGSLVVRVQDNYVVQWARSENDERAKSMSTKTLKPEFVRAMDPKLPFTRLAYPDTFAPEVGFSEGFPVARDRKLGQTWLVHCYGSVGVGRDNAADSGNGSELYAVIGQSPRHLDRNITLVGRVVQGIDRLAMMPRGTGAMGFYESPSESVPIRAVRVAADMPAHERVDLEALRTDSKTFALLVAARANRREPWFKVPAGRVDVCNVPLPVRRKAR
jgi:peptidylprolyl isomerase